MEPRKKRPNKQQDNSLVKNVAEEEKVQAQPGKQKKKRCLLRKQP